METAVKAQGAAEKPKAPAARRAKGQCLCGAVAFEIDVPAVWAWHDHSAASRRAHGAAYATYVGSWRSRYRLTKGARSITRFEDQPGFFRSFCTRCGAPVLYERPRAPKMINIPRALFETRTGRAPLYHLYSEEMQEWTYRGEALSPLKGFPGVAWNRARKKRPPEMGEPG